MTTRKTIKSAFESMMFVWGEPLDVKLAAEIFNISKQEAYDCFKELQEENSRNQRKVIELEAELRGRDRMASANSRRK